VQVVQAVGHVQEEVHFFDEQVPHPEVVVCPGEQTPWPEHELQPFQ